MSENGGGNFILGFLIGAMAGAAAALLMTPQSGDDLRHTIEKKSVDLKDEAARRAEEARVQAVKLAEEARGQVEHVGERGRIVLTENVRKAQQVVEEAKEKLASEPPALDLS